ncbi:MAG: carboxypeptidase regulatory-like domain-containing protein [bacterium]|nr:carboxypeptidase regulatory-like domain-containing protein [bacterium]
MRASQLLRTRAALAALLVLLGAAGAAAEPFHTPTVDGLIAGDGVDWESPDRVLDDFDDDGNQRSGNVRHLWLTWDEENLYLGLNYQALDRTVVVYLDAGLNAGPADAALLDLFPRALVLPQGRHIDLMLAQHHTGFTNLGTLRAWRVDDAAGALTEITSSTQNAQTYGVDNTFPGASIFWFRNEIAIPWSVVYPEGAPARAVLRAAVAVTPGTDGSGADDLMPGSGRLEGVAGPIQIAQMHASILDQDGDGEVDPLDAGASGTVTLQQDPGNAVITATATLTDWSGAALGGPLATVSTAAGVHEYRLGRLAAGTYTLQFSAPGYFPATTEVTVTAGQELTGADVTLEKATTITGTLSLELAGSRGGFEFRAPDGTVLAEQPLLLPNQFPYHFTFYVQESGDYELEAFAANHLRRTFTIPVVAGVDVTNLALLLPRAPLIAGSATFVSGPGAAGTVTIGNAAGDTVFATTAIGPGATAFSYYAPRLGNLTLRAEAGTYAPVALDVVAAAGQDQSGLALPLHRLPQLTGSIGFADGPGHAGRLILGGEGAEPDTLDFPAAGGDFAEAGGDLAPFFVPAGDYQLSVEADGYVPQSRALVVPDAPDQTVDAGATSLLAVRADRLRLLDDQGQPTVSVSATVSVPADDFYSYAPLRLEAVDAAGRRDLFDLDAKLADLPLTARKLDDVSPPGGDARFLGSEDFEDVVATASADSGLVQLWIADDAVEVLRLYVGPDVPDPLKQGPEPPTARFMVGFNDPRPAVVVLAAERDTLRTDGQDAVLVSAQLYDSAGNASLIPDIAVTFSVATSSTGAGAFTVPTVTTNADGYALAELTATGTGVLQIDAAVAIDGNVLEVRTGGPDGPAGRLPIVVIPGVTVSWQLAASAGTAGIAVPATIVAQLVDAYGNPTADAGVPLAFTASPSTLGSFAAPSTQSGADGRATAVFQPSGLAGVVTIGATSPSYPVEPVLLQLRDVAVETDPDWRNEPEDHNSFDTVDLTSVVLDNTLDELLLEIPFASDWAGVQLHVLLETNGDAGGAASDPFVMPVNYGHALRPDYALTSKYSANDYGDFRKASGAGWQFWSTATATFEDSPGTNNIQGSWVEIAADAVRIAIPFAALGGAPDSLRCEVYATQEDGGQKRSAFDSVPPDATLDLDFDYLDPQTGDWESTVLPTTLSAWGRTYRVKTDFPTPPTVTEAAAAPAELAAGSPYVLTARVQDAGDGVGDVLADLSATAGAALARMHDDGETAHGDAFAGDGVYSLRASVPPGSPGGERSLVVLAYDATNGVAARATAPVEITAQVEILRSTLDPEGDDHGPNQPAQALKYYTYPTNAVFVPGAFDLRSLDVYETTAVVAGRPVAMLAFEIGVGDFPNPADPGMADWNPTYGEMNIQKLDLLIDSAPGGATTGLPNRRLDLQPWNAWDYAVIMDGWYKALVPSLGLNSLDAWRENALRNDVDMQFSGDFDRNTITALVSKAALGNPTADDVRNWNIAVLMSSHDFGGEEVLGGVRWVNESRSEWNFGGGHYTDRDANVMDLLLSPGAGRQAGLPQEQILDYDRPEALDRLALGLAACSLEISAFEDTGPPVIRIVKDYGEVVRREPLRDAPIAFTLEISDDYAVDHATFRYRPTNAAGAWSAESPMGYVGDDLWSVDIPADWLDENLVYSPVDGTRYLEFQVEAVDASAEHKTTVSPVTTMQIEQTAESLRLTATLAPGEVRLRQVEGSTLVLDDVLRGRLVDFYRERTGSTLSADSLSSVLEFGWELRRVPDSVRSAPAATDARPLGVTREVRLDIGGATESLLPELLLDERLPGPLSLTLHYMQSDLPAGADEDQVAIFEYHAAANRWVLVGGNVNPDGNEVTVNTDHAGTYGLFWARDLGYDTGEVVSGVTVSPNPFSPNGDGLYDQTTISFYLDREASITLEVYNIDGKLKTRLQETVSYTGDDDAQGRPRRVAGLIWDGTDANGDPVPYGVYVLRLLATYQVGGGNRTIGSNHPVAVIR